VGVGDLRIDRIASPEQHQIGVAHVVGRAGEEHLAGRDDGSRVVVTDLGIHAEDRGVEDQTRAMQPEPVAAVDVLGAEIPNDACGPARKQFIDGPVGNFPQRLVPGDPLPLALPAFAYALERMPKPSGLVHSLAEAGALLTAPRVEVRHIRVRLGVGCGLLLAEHHAFLDVHVEVAVRLVPAVHIVGALRDAVPRPARSVDVLPALIVGHAGSRLGGGRAQSLGGLEAKAAERQAENGGSRAAKETPPVEIRTVDHRPYSPSSPLPPFATRSPVD
jgi:hypothetical protein